MNGRARDALRAGWWWFTLAVALVWWAPAILLALATWCGDRLRFWGAMHLGRALVAAGWPRIASRVYAAEIKRNERAAARLRRRPS